ncbi:gsl2688 [Gloeobacter violaceus PCC 7421]|uniref:Gsl2688 protein n=1 Tax=Gloeobacter violaceus (strain ATCC 29082 / PCC 7421) TaxID=251221 RepID=Q7NH49_GLOVI|nr:gsl2688 [Gloeobacter violaceus PCC 7421]
MAAVTDPRQLIVQDPRLLGGKPAIYGTRLGVEWLLDKLAAGQTREQMLADYPTLYPEGIDAALAFAADFDEHHSIARLLAEYRGLRQ